jgi:hypothetical protein
MSEGWGNAIRDYAFAGSSGRLPASGPRPFIPRRLPEPDRGRGQQRGSVGGRDSAYGTPFPPATKAVLGGGWYFSLDQASDAAVAYLVSPSPAFLDALVSAP